MRMRMEAVLEKRRQAREERVEFESDEDMDWEQESSEEVVYGLELELTMVRAGILSPQVTTLQLCTVHYQKKPFRSVSLNF